MGRFQYSIRLMLTGTAIIAVGVAAISAEPAALSCLGLMLLATLFLGVAIVACLETTGVARSFWVGMLVSLGFAALAANFVAMWYVLMWTPAWEDFVSQRGFSEVGESVRRVVATFWCFAPIDGLLCVFARWVILRKPMPAPTQNLASK